MDDLISRAAAIDYLMTNMGWRDEDGYEVDDAEEKRAIITDLVNGIPAVDAAPVVHSFWHWTQDGYVYCENCKFPLAKTKVNIDGVERHLFLTTNYCAHCGAKMNGEWRDSE